MATKRRRRSAQSRAVGEVGARPPKDGRDLQQYIELGRKEAALRERADEIVNHKMWWAAGIGLLPLPVIDWAAVTAVQVIMINDLLSMFRDHGQPPVTKQTVRKWVTALAGGFVPTYLKAVPVFGFTIGMLTGPVLYGGITYALGKVFIQHLETGGTLLTFNADKMRGYFEYFLNEGKRKLMRQRDLERDLERDLAPAQ